MYVISQRAKLHNRAEKKIEGRRRRGGEEGVTINFRLAIHDEINFNRAVVSRTKYQFLQQYIATY